METIGDRLARVRSRYDLSQQSMARRLGIAQSTLSQLEKGASPLKSTILKKLSESFHVNIHWMLTGEGSMWAGEQEGLPLVRGEDRARYISAQGSEQVLRELTRYRIPGFEQRGDLIFTIEDNSMAPFFLKGDHVICEGVDDLVEVEIQVPVIVLFDGHLEKGIVARKQDEKIVMVLSQAHERALELREGIFEKLWVVRARVTRSLRETLALNPSQLDHLDEEIGEVAARINHFRAFIRSLKS